VPWQGDGRAFCSGLDFPSVATNPLNIAKLLKRDDAAQAANLAQAVGHAWRALPVPVIACIHGVCFGGGLQIALGADFRYATPDAQLSIMEVCAPPQCLARDDNDNDDARPAPAPQAKWGLIPDMSASVTLRELVRADVAKELSMTGRIVPAPEARDLGLLTRVCDDPLQVRCHGDPRYCAMAEE
jgi:enoyl-CoA hydratase/carnithine racemase